VHERRVEIWDSHGHEKSGLRRQYVALWAIMWLTRASSVSIVAVKCGNMPYVVPVQLVFGTDDDFLA
jgi:hypothetical protein